MNMHPSRMEQDYFRRVLNETFPEIYQFVVEGGILTFSDVQRLIGNVQRVDQEMAISNAAAFATGKPDGVKKRRVALCPAGGFYRDVLLRCERGRYRDRRVF